MEQSAKRPKKLLSLIVLSGLVMLAGCTPTTAPSSEVPRVIPIPQTTPNAPTAADTTTGVIVLPEGFQIEKVVDGLTYPTSVTWDDQGQMYVAEAGGGFLPEPPPARILRIENGQAI